MTTKTHMTAFFTCAFLAACGGSGGGGGDDVAMADAIAASGFAKQSDNSLNGNRFDIRNLDSFTISAASGVEAATIPVTVTFSADGNSVELTMGGMSETLTLVGAGEFETDENESFLYSVGSLANSPLEMYVGAVAEGQAGNLAVFPVGFDTDPNTIGNQTGTVTYSGSSMIQYFGNVDGERPDGDQAFGDFSMTANFGSENVSGTLTVTDEDTLDTLAFALGQGAINGNAFNGALTLTSASGDLAGTTISNGTYEGRFYDADAGAVGGTISADAEASDGSEALLRGAFIGEAD